MPDINNVFKPLGDTVSEVIETLRSQGYVDDREGYSYPGQRGYTCPVVRWLKDHGYPYAVVASYAWWPRSLSNRVELPPLMVEVLYSIDVYKVLRVQCRG